MYRFRLTSQADIARIMEIIGNVQDDFRQKGIDQWLDGYPSEDVFLEDISHQESYVIEKDGQVVATAMISFRPEPSYDNIDGEWLTPLPYVVIHRIAVDPKCRGQRIAESIIDETRRLCKERGITQLRIDTHNDNKAMQRVAERIGCTYCGIIYVRGGAARMAYEAKLC